MGSFGGCIVGSLGEGMHSGFLWGVGCIVGSFGEGMHCGFLWGCMVGSFGDA